MKLPSGTFRFADALDDDGLGSGPVRIAVTLTVGGGRLRADFAGSAPQTQGPVNAVEPVTRAATYYAVRVALGESLPINAGTFRRIEVLAPAGSVVHARPPAAVAAGNVETSQRIVDVVLGALALFGRRRPIPLRRRMLRSTATPRDGASAATGHGASFAKAS